MTQPAPGVVVASRWIKRNRVSIRSMGTAVGDPDGKQLHMWLTGYRQRLPLPIKVRFAEHTGLPLMRLLDRKEREVALGIRNCLERDEPRPPATTRPQGTD